jgi:hypothetical protein
MRSGTTIRPAGASCSSHAGGRSHAPGGVQVPLRALGHICVDVDRGHLPLRAGKAGQQRRVVPGAGTDLQHSMPRTHLQLLQHPSYRPRRRRRADSHPLRIPMSNDIAVGVRLLDRHARQKHVSRHSTHRVLDRSRTERLPLAQLIDQFAAKLGREVSDSAGFLDHLKSC